MTDTKTETPTDTKVETKTETKVKAEVKPKVTKKKATKKALTPPFRPGRQNIVFSMMAKGLTRKQMIERLPGVLAKANLGTSRNVRSLVDTTKVGLIMLNYKCDLQPDGTYKLIPPKKSSK